jgi:riboflavin kinase/FMN adenylyltransferase
VKSASAHLLDATPASLTGGVVAIGNFDGMHRGHATLLSVATTAARRLNVPAVALTFEPHPRTFFRPDRPVFRLTPLAAKERLAAVLGLDGLIVIPFDRDFASVTAEGFASHVLLDRLKAVEAVVGYDFHFGKNRIGSPQSLAEAGQRLGFPVTTVPAVTDEHGEPLSASRIRKTLELGDIATTNRMLGYRWFVVGTVVGGDRRGRDLGFPTANIRLPDDCLLRHGIYAVRFTRSDGTAFGGVASFGRRPTFDNGAPLLEVFVFDFNGSLYGEEVMVTFIDWLRPEERFPSIAALVEQMNRDTARTREILAGAGPGTAVDQGLAAEAMGHGLSRRTPSG